MCNPRTVFASSFGNLRICLGNCFEISRHITRSIRPLLSEARSPLIPGSRPTHKGLHGMAQDRSPFGGAQSLALLSQADLFGPLFDELLMFGGSRRFVDDGHWCLKRRMRSRLNRRRTSHWREDVGRSLGRGTESSDALPRSPDGAPA